MNALRYLIDFDRIDFPVRVREVARIHSHEIDTRVQAAGTRSLRALRELALIHLSGPSSTKVRVDNDTHVSEVLVNRTLPLLIHSWYTELRRVWDAIGDTGRDSVAWEEPMHHIIRRPFGRIDSSAIVIQSITVVVRSSSVAKQRAAPGVAIDCLIAVTGLKTGSLATTADRAVVTCVH